mgnify:CR=1 FL=1
MSQTDTWYSHSQLDSFLYLKIRCCFRMKIINSQHVHIDSSDTQFSACTLVELKSGIPTSSIKLHFVYIPTAIHRNVRLATWMNIKAFQM